jgi:hypothetical protein
MKKAKKKNYFVTFKGTPQSNLKQLFFVLSQSQKSLSGTLRMRIH